MNTLHWITRALWKETAAISLQYPIELVPQAGPRDSLHYYVFTERLFFDAMQLDEHGIPMHRSRLLGAFYNPAYVAWYGLMVLEQALRQGKSPDERFRLQVDWLVRNAVRRDNGSVVWPFPVDVSEGECKLRAPWVSAMIQGLVISLLVRAYRHDSSAGELMDICRAAVDVYGSLIEDGGVRSCEDGYILYEEYPAFPLPRVMDGFLFSLLGLYDLWIQTEDLAVRRRFDEGVHGLVKHIDAWDYRGRWTWYGSHKFLCPPEYHVLNRLLAASIGRLTGEELLSRYARSWDPARLDLFQRLSLFSTFFVVKQQARLRTLLQRA